MTDFGCCCCVIKAFHPLWARDAAAQAANLPSSPGLKGVTMRCRLRGGLSVGGTRGGDSSTVDATMLGGWMGLRKQRPPTLFFSPSRQGAGWGAPGAVGTLGIWVSAKSARRCFSVAESTL